MNINFKYFPILKENESNYFAQLQGVLESADEFLQAEITHTPTSYLFRIVPSTPGYNDKIISALIDYHNMLGIRLNFSKSIKTTGTINFRLKFGK